VSCNNGVAAAGLFGGDRQFDVAMHDYGPWTGQRSMNAEYWIPSEGTQKLETAGANVVALPPYDYYAFLDDDLEISTESLNRLFEGGEAQKLELYQPALLPDSYGSWPHLFQQGYGLGIRSVPFVEVMCPFFSRAALMKCLWSFGLNQSGWGLDVCIWPKLVSDCHVIDAVTIGHRRPVGTARQPMRNGLTALQEFEIVKKINYDGQSPW